MHFWCFFRFPSNISLYRRKVHLSFVFVRPKNTPLAVGFCVASRNTFAAFRASVNIVADRRKERLRKQEWKYTPKRMKAVMWEAFVASWALIFHFFPNCTLSPSFITFRALRIPQCLLSFSSVPTAKLIGWPFQISLPSFVRNDCVIFCPAASGHCVAFSKSAVVVLRSWFICQILFLFATFYPWFSSLFIESKSGARSNPGKVCRVS